LPYLSTLQPHFRQVQPPHIASSDDVGLRIMGSRSPQRGHDVGSDAPFAFRLRLLPDEYEAEEHGHSADQHERGDWFHRGLQIAENLLYRFLDRA
jgi:hypothetical protein